MLRNAREIYLIDFKRIFQNWFGKKEEKEEEENLLIVRIARKSRDQKNYFSVEFAFEKK